MVNDENGARTVGLRNLSIDHNCGAWRGKSREQTPDSAEDVRASASVCYRNAVWEVKHALLPQVMSINAMPSNLAGTEYSAVSAGAGAPARAVDSVPHGVALLRPRLGRDHHRAVQDRRSSTLEVRGGMWTTWSTRRWNGWTSSTTAGSCNRSATSRQQSWSSRTISNHRSQPRRPDSNPEVSGKLGTIQSTRRVQKYCDGGVQGPR
jgi:hypothetical protein